MLFLNKLIINHHNQFYIFHVIAHAEVTRCNLMKKIKLQGFPEKDVYIPEQLLEPYNYVASIFKF